MFRRGDRLNLIMTSTTHLSREYVTFSSYLAHPDWWSRYRFSISSLFSTVSVYVQAYVVFEERTGNTIMLLFAIPRPVTWLLPLPIIPVPYSVLTEWCLGFQRGVCSVHWLNKRLNFEVRLTCWISRAVVTYNMQQVSSGCHWYGDAGRG
jgi:hypothetical protein